MVSGYSECGGSEQALVARMDAGFLDVLHDAGDEDVLAVGEAVDIDFDGVGQIAVEQQRALGARPPVRDRAVEIVRPASPT